MNDIISVIVDGYASSAVICWAEPISVSGCDSLCYSAAPISEVVYFEPLGCGKPGNIINGKTPKYNKDYKITQLSTENDTCACDEDSIDTSKTSNYTLISSFTMPYFVDAEATSTTLYYTYTEEYYDKCGNRRLKTHYAEYELVHEKADCYGGDGPKSGIATTPLFQIEYHFYKKRPDNCCRECGRYYEHGTFANVPMKLKKDEDSFKLVWAFRVIDVDDDCNETYSYGTSALTISKENFCDLVERGILDLDKPCEEVKWDCEEGDISFPISGDVNLISFVPCTGESESATSQSFSITKYCTDDGDNGCKNEVTYCVDQSSVVIRNSKGEEIYNASSSATKNVPSYGDIVSVEFNFSATTTYAVLDENGECETEVVVGSDTVDFDIPPIKECTGEDILYQLQIDYKSSDGNVTEICEGVTISPNNSSGTGGRVEFTATSRTTTEACNSIIVELLQEGCDVDVPCQDGDGIEVYNNMTTLACNDYNGATLGTYYNKCATILGVECTDCDWISNVSAITPNIIGDIAENGGETRTATITLSYQPYNTSDTETATFTVKQNACYIPPCNCENLHPFNDDTGDGFQRYISGNTDLEYSGYTDSPATIGLFNIDDICEPTIEVDGDFTNQISNTAFTNGFGTSSSSQNFSSIYGNVTDNENPDEERKGNIIVSFGDKVCDYSDKFLEGREVIQGKFECDCEKIWKTDDYVSIPSAGGSFVIDFGVYWGKYEERDKPICIVYDKVDVSCSECISAYVDSTNIGVRETGYINITVGENLDEETKYFDIVVSNDGEDCFTITCVQEATPIECNCSLIELNIDHSLVDEPFSSAATAITAATYVDPPMADPSDEEGGGCTGSVEVRSSASWLTAVKDNGNIKCSWGAFSGNRSASVTISLEGETCGSFVITQGIPCPRYTIDPSNASGTGSTVTFTIITEE